MNFYLVVQTQAITVDKIHQLKVNLHRAYECIVT